MADGASIIKAYFTARKRLSANLRSLEKRAYFVRSKDGTLVSSKTLLPEIPKNVLKYRKKLKSGKELTKRQIEEIKASTRRLETLNKQRYEKTVGAGGVTARRQRQIEREQATFKAGVTKARKYREKEARENQRIREEIEAKIKREKEAAEEQREYEDEETTEDSLWYKEDVTDEYIEQEQFDIEYYERKQKEIEDAREAEEIFNKEYDPVEEYAREADSIVVNFLDQCSEFFEDADEYKTPYLLEQINEIYMLLMQTRENIEEKRENYDEDGLLELLRRLEDGASVIQYTIDLIKVASDGKKEIQQNLNEIAKILTDNRAFSLSDNSILNDYSERHWGYSA